MTWRLNESVNWNGQEWANNSDDHYIYYYGQEFLRRNGVAFTANETNWNTVLGCILKNDKIIPIDFQGKSLKITVIQVYAPPTKVKVYEVYWFYEDLYYILDQNIKTKKICFSYRELEYKGMNKKIPGVTGKFGLGVQNEAGERLKEFWQEKTWVIANTLFKNTRDSSTHGHHEMVSTKIRMTIFVAVKDREALYSWQNQDWKLTVAQIMRSLLWNSDLHWRKQGKPLGRLGLLWLYSRKDKKYSRD